MNIRHPKTVKSVARELLNRAGQLRQILLVYCGILLASCLVVTALGQGLGVLMSRSGGLGNLGTRSMLSTLQTLLPMAHTLVLLVLDLGLLAAMLRISRGQFTSPQTLRTGLSRFFPLLRLLLLQIPIYLALGLAAMYASMMLFFMTPLSNGAVELLMPMVKSGMDAQQLVTVLTTDDAVLVSFLKAVAPMYGILLVLMAAVMIPVSYRLGVAQLVIVEDPRAGAFRALSESFRMTRRNCMAFFKLDLSFWWYYLASMLVNVLPFLDSVVPMSESAGWLLYGLSLVLQIALYYFFRPRLEVSRCLIYNAIRPKPQSTGQAIGNIFQM
ncbi:MAG: DUF975 family protein [Faecousia sp.]